MSELSRRVVEAHNDAKQVEAQCSELVSDVSSSFECKCGKQTGWITPGYATFPCPECGRLYVGVEKRKRHITHIEAKEIKGLEKEAFINQHKQIAALENERDEARERVNRIKHTLHQAQLLIYRLVGCLSWNKNERKGAEALIRRFIEGNYPDGVMMIEDGDHLYALHADGSTSVGNLRGVSKVTIKRKEEQDNE